MKQRLLLLSLLFCFAATAMWAQAATKRLVLWQKSGEKVYFDLNDMPETTFENGLFVIKTNNATFQDKDCDRSLIFSSYHRERQ